MSPRRRTATTASSPARRRRVPSAAFAVPIILLLSALFVRARSAIAAPTSATRLGLVGVGVVGRFRGGRSSSGVGIRPKSAAAFVSGSSVGGAPTAAAFSSARRRSSSASSAGSTTTATTVVRGRTKASTTALASSLGFSPPPPPEDEGDDADDPLKWERMYEEGERSRGVAAASSPRRSSLKGSEVRVVTFDLDNTLWRTGKVITAANDALSEYLSAKGVVTPERTEAVMGELFRRDSARYCPLLAKEEEEEREGEIAGANGDGSAVTNVGQSNVYISSDKGHKPVLLTRLRKDAVREICVRHNGYSTSDAERFADDAFDVWTSARHGAIPHHLAESVVDSFERIRALRTSTGDPVVVGAVTDGNSDPRTVPGLGHYFDFVVNAESVGVSKPDRRVYYAAARELASFPALADLFSVQGGGASPTLDAGGRLVLDEDVLEDVIGPWWCHVGDDFIKDCVAAKDLRMRSVWCRELVLPSEEDSKTQKDDGKKNKKDVADLVKELAAMKVVEMSIGAEDFLADSIHREFTDAILDRFVDVGETVARWHEEGLRNAETMEAIADVLEVVVPDEPGTGAFDGVVAGAATAEEVPLSKETTAAVETAGAARAPPKRDTKFCMNCGAELPYEAKFCSDCGAKQPVL